MVVQRNAHSSTIDALILSGMRPTFMRPELDPELRVAHCITPETLDRALSDRRVFPSINAVRSGTRREELLIPAHQLPRLYILRKILSDMEPERAMQFLIDRMKVARSNDEFLIVMNS